MIRNLYSAVEALTIPGDEKTIGFCIKEGLQISIGHLITYKETKALYHFEETLKTDKLLRYILQIIFKQIGEERPGNFEAIKRLGKGQDEEKCDVCMNVKKKGINGLRILPDDIEDAFYKFNSFRNKIDVHRADNLDLNIPLLEDRYCKYLDILVWNYCDWDNGEKLSGIIDRERYKEDANVTAQSYIHMNKVYDPNKAKPDIKGDVKQMSERNNLTQVEKPSDKHDGMLIKAAQDNNLTDCKDAIEKGADVNAYDRSNGKSVLHYAVINKNLEMCEYLLEKGAKPNWRDNSGFTAFDYSLQEINEAIFEDIKEDFADRYDDYTDSYRDEYENTLEINDLLSGYECDPDEDTQPIFRALFGYSYGVECYSDDSLRELIAIPKLLEKSSAERAQYSVVHDYYDDINQLVRYLTDWKFESIVCGNYSDVNNLIYDLCNWKAEALENIGSTVTANIIENHDKIQGLTTNDIFSLPYSPLEKPVEWLEANEPLYNELQKSFIKIRK